MNHCRCGCYNILSFTQRWMPVHCCHFRCECFHVPRGENDDIPPRSNDNIWNPGRGGSWVRDCQAGSHCQSAAVTERGQMPGRLMPRCMPLCVWQLPALPKSRGGVEREEWWEKSSLRWAAMSGIGTRWVTVWECMLVRAISTGNARTWGLTAERKRPRETHRMSPKQCPFKTGCLALIIW